MLLGHDRHTPGRPLGQGVRFATATLALAVAVVGCSSSDAPTPAPATSDLPEVESGGSDFDSEPREVLDLGSGVFLDAPAAWEASGSFRPSVDSTDCALQTTGVNRSGAPGQVIFMLVGAGCTESPEGLNGSPPSFLTPDQILDGRDVVEEEVALGSVTDVELRAIVDGISVEQL